MIAVFSILIGYIISCSHEATVAPLLSPNYKKPLETTIINEKEGKLSDGALQTGYVKIHPGANIYFYTTEDENLMIGPKLQSEDEVTIFILDQDDDLKKFSSFKNSCTKYSRYLVLKSGVLVPKQNLSKKQEVEETLDKCNKCVYQSLKPTYYVKGFKDILIPVDVLYSKSKQEKLFNFKNLESKALSEPNTWRTDLKVSRLKKDRPLHFNDHSNVTWTSDPHAFRLAKESSALPENKANENFKRRDFRKDATFNGNEGENSIEDKGSYREDVGPDKTCAGEVTLFVLGNNGVFKRTPPDPFLPTGLRLSYSLLRNLMFEPNFLDRSNVVLSYIIGRNGDLIPHSENIHKVRAEDGNSVCFMLSKNGGMFPVKEEKGEDKLIRYFFHGNLVHQSRQFTETYSNSTSILINNKKFQFIERVDEKRNYEPLDLKEVLDEPKNNTPKVHHMQKRGAFYDRGGRMNPPHPIVDSPGVLRQPASVADQNRMMEYQSSSMRSQGGVGGRPPCPLAPELPPINNPLGDRRTSDMTGLPVLPPSPKMPSPHFDGNPQPGPPLRGMMYSPPGESIEQQPEEAPTDLASPAWETPQLRPRTDIFIFDEKGTRIPLIPEITDGNDVVIYKLTCKGNLVRYPPCKEPEFGFDIHFQLLLDEFVLVPTASTNKPFLMTYILQENGDLTPSEDNVNTFRKAPGSLIYYMLGKNNVLFPVQQIIDMEGNVSFFYQDFFLLKMKDSVEKPLHFTTKGSPLFAFFNGFTMITISSKPRLNPLRGSNWKHLKASDSAEGPLKTMYLTGPKGELIKISPYKNKQGATVIYELDCNGIFYRSPKDKKKCIILRSYMLLKDGILLPSNDTTGYVYMMSKNGDLFPYLYPDGKIEAPLASSLKYVLCEKGILLPIKLEIVDNYICYIFRDVVVYKERVFCKSCLDRLDEEQLDPTKNFKKSSCDIQGKETSSDTEIKLFINKDGDYVFYEKHNKVLKRYPPEQVPSYLKYTMGSFEVKPDGSLYQIRYQDPNENVANLMLEPNGDLLEDTRNVNNLRSQYYVLDAKGNLISVEAKKTKKNLYFYKDHVRLCRVPIPESEEIKNIATSSSERRTPLGKDPLGIMEDPYPAKDGSSADGDTRSLYIPIPLKSVSIADPPETCTECADAEHKKKCEMLKDTLKQVSKGSSLPLALELELTDEIVEELKNWAAKCDKVLSRRDVADDLRHYITNLNYLSVGSENV